MLVVTVYNASFIDIAKPTPHLAIRHAADETRYFFNECAVQSSGTEILIVNDDSATLTALRSLLDQWSASDAYAIFTATSGPDALRQVLKHDFAVILLDVNMPGMDSIRQRPFVGPRSALTPIIFVTAFQADELDKLKAFQLGASNFLFTPLIPQVLRAKVRVLTSLTARNAELIRQAEILHMREMDLNAANAQLQYESEIRYTTEKQSSAKDDFLAMLSHELRTPLSAISPAASLLAMELLPEASAERARLIVQRQTRHLRAIVDDLLDLTRATSGEIILDQKLIDLAGIVRMVADIFRTTRRTEGYAVSFSSSEHWVRGDVS